MTRPSHTALTLAIAGAVIIGCTSPLPPAPAKVYRIGWLLGVQAENASWVDLFRGDLRDLGYVEGRNVSLEIRYHEGDFDRAARQAAELAAFKVDVIVATGASAFSAKQATNTIPIVIDRLGGDPVALGLVASLANPGGNITGMTGTSVEIAGRRLQLLKEAVQGSRASPISSTGTFPPRPRSISKRAAPPARSGWSLSPLRCALPGTSVTPSPRPAVRTPTPCR